MNYSKDSKKKDAEDPQLFLAPCSNDDAYAHLRDTVIRRVPTETVSEFSDRDFGVTVRGRGRAGRRLRTVIFCFSTGRASISTVPR